MRIFVSTAAIAVTLISGPAMAEEPSQIESVRIEADQAAKAFVFIIDDVPVAMLDKAGLHVVDGIEYGRSISDAGPEAVSAAIASRMKEAAHE